MNKFSTIIWATAILGCSHIPDVRWWEVQNFNDPIILEALENTQKSCDWIIIKWIDTELPSKRFYSNWGAYNFVFVEPTNLLNQENHRLINDPKSNLNDKDWIKNKINICIDALNSVIWKEKSLWEEKWNISSLISNLKLIIDELPDQNEIIIARLNSKIENIETSLSEFNDSFIIKHYIIYSLLLIIISVFMANNYSARIHKLLLITIKKLENSNNNHILILSKIKDALQSNDKSWILIEIQDLLDKLENDKKV